jgi:hypothetical protein
VPNDDPPKRPGRRENVQTPGLIAWSQRLRGMSPLRKQRQEPGTREVRVHAIRLGGRNRSDVSSVFTAGDRKVIRQKEGASLEEVRSTA